MTELHPDKLYWKNQLGENTLVSELEYTHIFNIMIMLDSKIETSPWLLDSPLYQALNERLIEYEEHFRTLGAE